MIYDSKEQKDFILDAVLKYPTNYGTALQLAQKFGQPLQVGQVIDPGAQLKAFPPAGTPDAQAPPNGRNARRAATRADKKAKANAQAN